MAKKYLALACAALLSAVSANTYWRDRKFESFVEQRKAFSRHPHVGSDVLNVASGNVEDMDSNRENQDEQLYVHLIAHTHDDVGWLKTVDQYYSGSDEGDQQAEVNLVLSSVVEELLKNPERKFTYVEMKFFTMWYNEQSEETKDKLKRLIKEGRFEFINAGWSMHDEACPHYEDMINNMMKGHEFLKGEFGVVPRIGWHIDPFGHSSANPRLFADMGFEAWLFARLDHQDRDQRLEQKSMNFLWRPFSKHFGNQKQIFTGAMRDHYCWASGFWYDERFPNDDPFVTNKNLDTFNAKKKTKGFAKYINEMAGNYQGNHMLVPFGCDFTFANARMNFNQMDALIDYFNAHNDKNITLLYSTPGEYIDALNKQDITWPVKYDDMFPYSDNPQDYWSGYFTSRQSAKKFVRDGQANLHASSALFSKKMIQESTKDSEIEDIMSAKHAMLDWMGVFQHHDAIAGTAKQHVADNYVVHLSKSMAENNKVYSSFLKHQMKKDIKIKAHHVEEFFNGVQNDTIADVPMGQHDQDESIVIVHNPAAQVYTQLVRIKVASQNYSAKVWCSHDKEFKDVAVDVLKQEHRRNDGTAVVDYDMYFPYKLMPNQIGYVKIIKGKSEVQPEAKKEAAASLEFNGQGQAPLKFTFKANYTSVFDGSEQSLAQKFSVNIGYYAASQGKDDYPHSSNCAEGAYLFKPDRHQRFQYQYASKAVKLADYTVGSSYDIQQWTFDYHNKNMNESGILKVRFSPYFKNLIEFDFELNGIGVEDGQGKDVIVNWHFEDFDSGETFWTDSNGLEMQKRILNYRPSYKYSGDQNISANYYPINSAIAMRNIDNPKATAKQAIQVTVMNDRAQAGSATLQKGTIELIQNRRLIFDDDRGVDEPLNETDSEGYGMKVNARYWLNIFDLKHAYSLQREQQNALDQPLQFFFAFNYTQHEEDDSEKVEVENALMSAVKTQDSFEAYGKALTFPLGRNKFLLRVENTADRFDALAATNIEIDIVKFAFAYYREANGEAGKDKEILPEIFEVDLSNNQLEAEVMEKRKKNYWKGADDEEIAKKLQENPELKEIYERNHLDDAMTGISLEPQRIRSFLITYETFKSSDASFLQ